jgi:CHAT domain-containing protein
MNNYSVKLRQRVLDGLGFDHQWQDTLHGLCRVLVPPAVLTQLDQARTLLIVPHHILHYFPFAALVTERDTSTRDALEIVKPRFLIDEPFSYNYAPSLIAWDALRQRSDRSIVQADAIGIANLPGAAPLPGVETEIRSLQTAFGASLRTVVTGQSAHKASAFALLKQPGLLLIGTHGQNWPDWPLASELLLYPRGRENGRLTAAELYFSNVDRDLVVLSACYTGLADKSPLPGDDLFGLQRALLQSGARSVVSGQWDIYDGTGPELMHYFFDHLAKGKRAPQALADSQRQFLARLRVSSEPEPWLHPYFWAVFTVAGDDRIRFQR